MSGVPWIKMIASAFSPKVARMIELISYHWKLVCALWHLERWRSIIYKWILCVADSIITLVISLDREWSLNSDIHIRFQWSQQICIGQVSEKLYRSYFKKLKWDYVMSLLACLRIKNSWESWWHVRFTYLKVWKSVQRKNLSWTENSQRDTFKCLIDHKSSSSSLKSRNTRIYWKSHRLMTIKSNSSKGILCRIRCSSCIRCSSHSYTCWLHCLGSSWMVLWES